MRRAIPSESHGLAAAAPVGTLAASLALLALAAVFVAARLLLPGDGVPIELDADPARGLAVQPVQPVPGGLQAGDIILAIDGRSPDDWLRLGWQRPLAAPPAGSVVHYTVQRAGNAAPVAVAQRLGAYPMAAALQGLWSSFVFMAYLQLVGLFVFWRRPALPTAQALFLLSTAILSSGVVFFLGLQASDLRLGWVVALWLAGSVLVFGGLVAGLLHFALIFPVRNPLLMRHPRLLWLVYGGVWLPLLLFAAIFWANALGPAARLLLVTQATASMLAVYLPLVLLVALVSYRHARPGPERRQLRWPLWAFLVVLPVWLVDVVPGLAGRPSPVPAALLGLLWCIIPTAFAISILREKLFDIDVLIHRSAVYGSLTLALALIYLGSVVVLQIALRAFTGQVRSELATVASTLLAAALANPLRRRIQGFIDRRFYRRRYDAARVLAAFAASVRADEAADLDRLMARLLWAVDESMQPNYLSVWLRPERQQQ